MKTGIILTARLGSTRLKRKHLLPVNGNPIIIYLIKRVLTEFKKEKNSKILEIIIATSSEKENREFEVFKKNGVYVFYGSNDNIPLRHFQAAMKYRLDSIISVDGDDILCSKYGMRRVYEALQSGRDYVKTSNLPIGMNSEGYLVEYLKGALEKHHDDILETGWDRIFDESNVFNIHIPFDIDGPSLRFTLDYQEDYIFFKKLIESLKDEIFMADDKMISDYVIRHKLFNLNKSVSKKYWENYEKLINDERKASN